MSTRDAAVCEACQVRPRHLSMLCPDCAADFEGHLHRLPRLRDELSAALVRQGGAAAGPSGGAALSSPVPINLTASELLGELDRLTSRLRAAVPAHRRRPGTTLVGHVGDLVLVEGIGALVAQLWWLYDRARRLSEPPAERVGLGACGCGQELFAPTTARFTRCRDCGNVHDVQARLVNRSAVRERDFAEYWLTPVQVEAATSGRVRADRVRQWVHRDKIAVEDGKVRFGDVLDLENPRSSGVSGRRLTTQSPVT